MIPIGTGIDITEVERIEALAQEHEQFLSRVFTQKEISYCSKKKNRFQHFAARFAAKESVLKALGIGWSGNIRWTDIEVVNQPNGKPEVATYGEVRRIMELKGINEVFLSLSHTSRYAIASVQLFKREDNEVSFRRSNS